MTNEQVDFYFNKASKWKKELEQLRQIVLQCPLIEELKWGCPCYTFQKKNVVVIHGFKEYCAILFFKGALLKDTQGLLIQQTEHVQAGRQIRFDHVPAIVAMEAALKAYIEEAIEVEKMGLKVHLKTPAEFAIAEEFQHKLDTTPALKTAFDSLTPGRRRAYLLHFSTPKQSKTRTARVEQCVQKILNGKGLND